MQGYQQLSWPLCPTFSCRGHRAWVPLPGLVMSRWPEAPGPFQGRSLRAQPSTHPGNAKERQDPGIRDLAQTQGPVKGQGGLPEDFGTGTEQAVWSGAAGNAESQPGQLSCDPERWGREALGLELCSGGVPGPWVLQLRPCRPHSQPRAWGAGTSGGGPGPCLNITLLEYTYMFIILISSSCLFSC